MEFIDSSNHGAGADSISDNVTATLVEIVAATDTTGAWSLGTLSAYNTPNNNVGEFLVGGIWDTYTITTSIGGLLHIETDEDLFGVSGGDTVDTELALFDSSGTLVAYSDNDGNGLYSEISGFQVAAGDTYTVAVVGFGSSISGAGIGSFQLADMDGGTSTGDYTIEAFLVVPEPVAASLLAVFGIVGFTRRRR